MVPPKIPYGEFASVRFQGRYIRRAFLATTRASRRQFASALRAPRCLYRCTPVLSPGTRCADAPPLKRLMPLYPRGPRSGPGCSVPVHQHLIGPMRPPRRRSSISPQSGLYALPSLCARLPRLSDPRGVPCFRWPAVSTCRPLGPRDAHRLRSSSCFADDAGLRPEVMVSALPISSPSDSREGQRFRGLTTVRFRYDLLICSPFCRS